MTNFRQFFEALNRFWKNPKTSLQLGKDRKKGLSPWTFVLLLIGLTFFLATPAHALNVTLTWDANTEADLSGYKVYYKTVSPGSPYNGTSATEGNAPIDVGNVTQFTLNDLTDGQTYYFVVTAYDLSNNESGYSNEVQSAPGTTPPDIFDINEDSAIDILDVSICVNVILGTETDTNRVARADVNGDGAVDILDVMGVLNEILGTSN